jgi:hypothetical protein
MNETFRPRSNFAWAGSAYILIILFGVNSIVVGTNAMQTVFELIVCVIFGIVVYGIWIKPKIVLDMETIQVINPFRTEIIRYDDILDLETKWSLTIRHTGGETRAWVAPASGKQRWIADKKLGWYSSGLTFTDSKGDNGREVSMSGSLESLSGQAAHMIRERMKRNH